ncbi:MAG: ABC transporter substrate-binding protein [Azoarcus sp.]|nr:ABC transporter substrate-binding protein [Azoarcus sp.]
MGSPRALAGEIIDMAGRKVLIPDYPDRVFGAAPPVNVLLSVVAPEVMLGLNFPIPAEAADFFPLAMRELPIVSVFGLSPQINAEAVLTLKPDFALGWQSALLNADRMESTFRRMGLPLVLVKMERLEDWPTALRFTGGLLGRAERAEMLAQDVETTLARLQTLRVNLDAAPKRRLRVYYAEGPDGLSTACHASLRASAIELAGGYNVRRCSPGTRSHGTERIGLEEVLLLAPDIIIAHDPAFPALARADSRWQHLAAVRENRICLAPRWPHNWIDRPPSVMQALGAQWLANLLYPQDFPLDLKAETRRFYQLFLGVPINDAQLESLLLASCV